MRFIMIMVIVVIMMVTDVYGGVILQENAGDGYRLTIYVPQLANANVDIFKGYFSIANEAACVYDGIRVSSIGITSNLQNIPLVDAVICDSQPCTNFLPQIPNSSSPLNKYIMFNSSVTSYAPAQFVATQNAIKYVYAQLITYYNAVLNANLSATAITFTCFLSGNNCITDTDCTNQTEDYCDITYPQSLLYRKYSTCSRTIPITIQIFQSPINNSIPIIAHRNGNITENAYFQQIMSDMYLLAALPSNNTFTISSTTLSPAPKFVSTQKFTNVNLSISYNYDGSLSPNPPICYVDNIQDWNSNFVDLTTYYQYKTSVFVAEISIANLLKVNNIDKSTVGNYTQIYDINGNPVTSPTTNGIMVEFTNIPKSDIGINVADCNTCDYIMLLSNSYYTKYDYDCSTEGDNALSLEYHHNNCMLGQISGFTVNYYKLCPPYNVYTATVGTYTEITDYQQQAAYDASLSNLTMLTTTIFANYGAGMYENADSQNVFDQIVTQQLFDKQIAIIIPPYCISNATSMSQYISYLSHNLIKLHIFTYDALDACYDQLLHMTIAHVHIVNSLRKVTNTNPMSQTVIDQYVDFIASINGNQIVYTVTSSNQFMIQANTYDVLHITNDGTFPPLYNNSGTHSVPVAYPATITQIGNMYFAFANITFGTNTTTSLSQSIIGPYQFSSGISNTQFIIYFMIPQTITSHQTLICKTYNFSTPTYHIIAAIPPNAISIFTSQINHLVLQQYGNSNTDNYYHYITDTVIQRDSTIYIAYYNLVTQLFAITNGNHMIAAANVDTNDVYMQPIIPQISQIVSPVIITSNLTNTIYSNKTSIIVSNGGSTSIHYCDGHAYVYCYIFMLEFILYFMLCAGTLINGYVSTCIANRCDDSDDDDNVSPYNQSKNHTMIDINKPTKEDTEKEKEIKSNRCVMRLSWIHVVIFGALFIFLLIGVLNATVLTTINSRITLDTYVTFVALSSTIPFVLTFGCLSVAGRTTCFKCAFFLIGNLGIFCITLFVIVVATESAPSKQI